jgi:uncharacterized protein YqeY
MSIEQDLRKLLTDSMKSKDLRTADVLRMINTKVMERRTAKGFTGQVDDALVTEVIAAYKKSLVKAREEYLAVGERGKADAEALAWEIELCEKLLPKGPAAELSGEALREVVKAAIAALGATDPKMAGRVVGEVMKQHKGKVDAGEVKKVAEAELAPKT